MHHKYEGSKIDERRDRREAKKRGMTTKQWEHSAADRKMDREGQRKLDQAAKHKKRRR